PPATLLSTLSLHDALPISSQHRVVVLTDHNGEFTITLVADKYAVRVVAEGFMDALRQINRREPNQNVDIVLEVGIPSATVTVTRSEEHTSELQSLAYLVCR